MRLFTLAYTNGQPGGAGNDSLDLMARGHG